MWEDNGLRLFRRDEPCECVVESGGKEGEDLFFFSLSAPARASVCLLLAVLAGNQDLRPSDASPRTLTKASRGRLRCRAATRWKGSRGRQPVPGATATMPWQANPTGSFRGWRCGSSRRPRGSRSSCRCLSLPTGGGGQVPRTCPTVRTAAAAVRRRGPRQSPSCCGERCLLARRCPWWSGRPPWWAGPERQGVESGGPVPCGESIGDQRWWWHRRTTTLRSPCEEAT